MGATFKVPALSRFCQVDAYLDWIVAAQLDSGPVYRRVDRSWHVGEGALHVDIIAPLLRTILGNGGLSSAALYSGQVLRRGFTGWAATNGSDVKSLTEYVGWRDANAALKYVDAAAPLVKDRMYRTLSTRSEPINLFQLGLHSLNLKRDTMDEAELWQLSPGDVRKLRHAAALLNALAGDAEQLDILLDLQRFLAQRIRSRERIVLRVRQLEARLKNSLRKGRLEKAESTRVRGLLEKCSVLIARARRWIFLWKCFGDGAACVYQSPYNLKLLLYDQHYRVKQEAGFITGKSGFVHEWKILEHGIRSGVPVVLSDLTNMLRIGDICALAGPDPMPIELKSSWTSGARAARQQQLLEEVTAFFENDGAKQFKGQHNVERYPVQCGPDYRQQMNDCIRQARADGYAVVSPELGLQYVAVTVADQLERMSELFRPWVLLRSLSAELDWVPCMPFTLTLEPDNLIAFISGAVAVFVLTDMERLKSLFLQHGNHATMIMDGQSAIQLCIDPSDLMRGVFRISELIFGRVALEFQSLAWFAKEHAIKNQEWERSITREEFEALPQGSYCFEIPEAWAQVKDFYADVLVSPAQTQHGADDN